MTAITLTTVFHQEVHSLVNTVVTTDDVVVNDVNVKHILTEDGLPETLLTPFGADEIILWCDRGHVSATKVIATWMTHGFFA